jgi:RHS repeat-associated protein
MGWSGNIQSLTGASGTQSIGYDLANRVTSVVPGVGTPSYVYSLVGDRVTAASRTTDTGTAPVYAFGYDLAGNMSAVSQYDVSGTAVMTTTCLLHDALGRLVQAGPAKVLVGPGETGCQKAADLASSTAVFEYDVRNRRVARFSGGAWTEFVQDGEGHVLAEELQPSTAAGAWTSQREYVWLDGLPLAQFEYPGPAGRSDGFVYFYHLDHIGLPRALTNANGTAVWSAAPVRPYGDVMEEPGTDPLSGRPVVTNVRLPGQYDERLFAAVGITSLQGPYYNWNRWYLPSMGRYMELDPIAVNGGFNGSYGPNWYGYAEGNPLKNTDPAGLFVTGVYDCKTGRLTMMDTDTGATAQMDAESGGKPFGDPIPDGMWEILEQARRPDFYRLDAWDSTPRDDIHDPTGRDNFRLHKPGRTIGCIAAKDQSGWDGVKSLVDRTRTDKVMDVSAPWWKFWSRPTPIKRYGNIFVVNCGP